MRRFRLSLCFNAALLAAALSIVPVLRAQTPADAPQADAAPPDAMAQQVAEIQKIADRWDDAIEQHDQYALELVLAPNFINITDTGEVGNRDQVVSRLVMKDALRYTLKQNVTSVRMIGDAAVVNGVYTRAYQGSKLSRTKPREEKGVFSQVYMRARSSWQCVNSQRTRIEAATAVGKKKNKSDSEEKPLSHGLGFQLPGRHHSDTQPR